jgi:tRNA-modifying protein YgfZ
LSRFHSGLEAGPTALTFRGEFWQETRIGEPKSFDMQAALLPNRGVLKVAGDDARRFLNGLATNDMAKAAPGTACYAALLSPQGKIIADFIVTEAPAEDGGGLFLDVPRALAPTLVQKLNFYKLRAKITVEDLSEALGVLAVWDGAGVSEYGLCYADPRLAALGWRIMLPPQLAAEAAEDLRATPVGPESYEAHRIALGVPHGGEDFVYGNTFPHEADMDQLAGIDFDKGCYVGQEVVSRVEHRNSARSRIVPVAYDDLAPSSGAPVMAGDKQVGTFGSAAQGRGLALLRLDRVEDALAAGLPLTCGDIRLRVVKPARAGFTLAGETQNTP